MRTTRIQRAGLALILCSVALSLFLSSRADAQTLTFTAETVTGNGSVVPKLTWATTPAATSCTASGATDWTGSKAGSGTETLAAITSSKTYALACTWPGDTKATIKWTAPTQNTDGTALAKCASQTATGACLRSFTIHEGPSATSLPNVTPVNDRNATQADVSNLIVGTHFFAVRAVTGDGVSSDLSGTASKTITAAPSVTRNVAITVNPQPNPPANVTAE